MPTSMYVGRNGMREEREIRGERGIREKRGVGLFVICDIPGIYSLYFLEQIEIQVKFYSDNSGAKYNKSLFGNF